MPDQLGDLVGQHGLAGTVDPIDGDRDALLREERDDAVGESEHSGIPLDGEEA